MGHGWKGALWRGLAFALVLEAMLVPAILFWPTFQENAGALRAMAPIQALKKMLDTLAAGGVAAYVAGQHFLKGCNTLGTAAAVLFAASAVAGEVHRGTLEIWLARPLSRRRILAERWAQGALAVVLPVFATTATIPWLLGFVDETMPLLPLMLCAVHQSAFLLAIYGVAFFLSTMGSSPMPIAFGVLLFTIFEFAIYLVQTITHWSIFRLVDIPRFMEILGTNRLDWPRIAGMAAATGVLFLASQIAFARRVP